MFTRYLLVILCLLTIPALALCSDGVRFSDLSLPMTPGTTAAAFMTVTSPEDDAITAAESSCCTAVELHQHEMQGAIMRMRRVASVPLTANEPTVFAPHGLHVMLIGLKKPLVDGDVVTVIFHFTHAPAQPVTFTAHARALPDSMDSPKHP